MDAKLQRRIQRYGWDRAASLYEESWKRQLAPAQERLLQMARLAPGERVLDVACGTGLVSFPAAAAVGPEGRVVGTDISDEMVASCRESAVRLGFDQTAFLRMDAESLDFPDQSFDAALCALGLMYVPDPGAALTEMFRVLAPGGRAVGAVWGERSRCGWADIFPIVDSRVKSEVCPMFFQLGTAGSLEREVKAAGFTGLESDRIETVLAYDSGEEACLAAFAGGPVALAYSRFDESTRMEACAEYLRSIEPYRSGEGYQVPGEFVVVRGVRP